MKLSLNRILMVVILFFSFSCKKGFVEDYNSIETFSKNGLVNALIEIPAGTNLKIEYDKKTHQFSPDSRNGSDRKVTFLPYIGNYGFIPSTYSDPIRGGDGDGLDILVLSESTPTGTVMETIPIAVLKLLDNAESDYKIIAIPKDINKRIINTVTFSELKLNYPSVIKIIEEWFLNYDQEQTASIEGWGDEKDAINEITKSIIQ